MVLSRATHLPFSMAANDGCDWKSSPTLPLKTLEGWGAPGSFFVFASLFYFAVLGLRIAPFECGKTSGKINCGDSLTGAPSLLAIRYPEC